jgi:hypothetical protein
MIFEIPKEDIAAIATIKAMPSASVDALLIALKSVPPTVETEEVAKRVAEHVPSVTARQLEAILDTLRGLYYVRELAGVERPTFLEDFMEGFQIVPELRVERSEVPKLREKFEKLLNVDAFNLLAKAKRLQRDGERLYCDAKIISDIRPVFGAEPTARPIGAVVTHTLKIGYHEGEAHREFHIILDSVDLDALSGIISRAEAKDGTLRDLLREIRLSDLGL